MLGYSSHCWSTEIEFRVVPMSQVAKRSITLLDESKSGDVCVISLDEDRFVLTVEEAVRACKASDRAYRFSKQFETLLSKTLPDWIRANRSLISSVHLTIRQSDMLLVVVQKKIEMDTELVDSLSDLDIKIASDESLDMIKLNVMSLPLVESEGVSAFLSNGDVYQYAD